MKVSAILESRKPTVLFALLWLVRRVRARQPRQLQLLHGGREVVDPDGVATRRFQLRAAAKAALEEEAATKQIHLSVTQEMRRFTDVCLATLSPQTEQRFNK